MQILDLQAQEAMLINELLVTPPVTRSQVELWQMYKFFDGRVMPEAGGLNDQIFNDIVTLRRMSFVYAIIETVLEIRDKRTQQNVDLEKLARSIEGVA